MLLFLVTTISYANNPVVSHIYTADSAGLAHNGRFYLYTGHDESDGSGYMMHNWHVFSSTDMVNWTDHGERLSVSTFSWARADAWASQCIEKDGKFYWYVCLEHNNGGKAVGVAVGNSPTGPFTDPRGSVIITNNMITATEITWDDIDPTALVDDDSQAYLIWGNTVCY